MVPRYGPHRRFELPSLRVEQLVVAGRFLLADAQRVTREIPGDDHERRRDRIGQGTEAAQATDARAADVSIGPVHECEGRDAWYRREREGDRGTGRGLPERADRSPSVR